MSDNGEVSAKVTADASPFIKTMALVKAKAKETGESLGLEFDRGAQRAEQRTTRGIDGILKGLSNAKNPIEVTSALIEGMGKSFGIASGLFATIGVGAVAAEEIMKAYEASEKLGKSLDKMLSVNPDNESINQLQKDINDFQKTADEYANRGMVEKILFGDENDAKFKSAEALNDVKKNLVEIEGIQQDIAKQEIRLLEASANPEDREEGKSLQKNQADDKDSSDLYQKLEDQQTARQKLQDSLSAFDAKTISDRNHNYEGPLGSAFEDDANSPELQAIQKQRDSIVSAIKDADKVIQDRKQEILAQALATQAERFQAEDEQIDEHFKKQVTDGDKFFKELQSAELEKQNAARETQKKITEINRDSAYAAATPKQKVGLLQQDVADDQSGINSGLAQLARDQAAPTSSLLAGEEKIKQVQKDRADIADLLIKKNQDQAKLAELLLENEKARAGLQYEAFKTSQEATAARAEAVQDNAQAQIFHGQVSSLQRIGGGGRIGVNQNHEQLHAAQEANKKLEQLNNKIAVLNSKIEGL